MFNTQKSDDQVNTQRYRNSTLIKKKKKPALVSDWIGIGWYWAFSGSDRIGSEKMVSLHPYPIPHKHICWHSDRHSESTCRSWRGGRESDGEPEMLWTVNKLWQRHRCARWTADEFIVRLGVRRQVWTVSEGYYGWEMMEMADDGPSLSLYRSGGKRQQEVSMSVHITQHKKDKKINFFTSLDLINYHFTKIQRRIWTLKSHFQMGKWLCNNIKMQKFNFKYIKNI